MNKGHSAFSGKSVSLRGNVRLDNDEISEPISQGEHGAETSQDGGMEKALSELQRGSEEDVRNAQKAGRTLSRREEVEARVVERYVKENGILLMMQ